MWIDLWRGRKSVAAAGGAATQRQSPLSILLRKDGRQNRECEQSDSSANCFIIPWHHAEVQLPGALFGSVVLSTSENTSGESALVGARTKPVSRLLKNWVISSVGSGEGGIRAAQRGGSSDGIGAQAYNGGAPARVVTAGLPGAWAGGSGLYAAMIRWTSFCRQPIGIGTDAHWSIWLLFSAKLLPKRAVARKRHQASVVVLRPRMYAGPAARGRPVQKRIRRRGVVRPTQRGVAERR